MARDRKLFQDFEKGLISPTIRIYSWSPACVSLGYSQNLEEEIDLDQCRHLGWDVVKRPTGGGIVFHNTDEVTYSIVTGKDSLPGGLIESYKSISRAVVLGLNKLGIKAELTVNSEQWTVDSGQKAACLPKSPDRIGGRRRKSRVRENLCFSYPAEYEIVVDGRKLVGSAQRRGRRALLQQGSIFVSNKFNGIFSALKKPIDLEAYHKEAISVQEILGDEIKFQDIMQALIMGFEIVTFF